MICSKTVFRCFKTLERWGDKITGAAGRYFVILAVCLTTLGTVVFCELQLSFITPPEFRPLINCALVDVIMPNLRYPILTGPFCVLIAANLHMHYYYVCTVPPGFVDAPLHEQEYGPAFLWAKTRDGRRRPMGWGLEGGGELGGLEITPAAVTSCRKCGETKPEVSARNVLGLLVEFG